MCSIFFAANFTLIQYGNVSFDWKRGIVRVGKAIIPISTKAFGGNPLERAKTVKQVAEGNLSSTGKDVINPKLTWNQRRRMTGLLNEYKATFDEKPGKTDFCDHRIDTGGAIPMKSRPRRLPPRWEGEINQQLDGLLSQRLRRPVA